MLRSQNLAFSPLVLTSDTRLLTPLYVRRFLGNP